MTTTALVVTTVVIVLGIYDLAAVVIGRIRGQGIKFSISRFMQGLPRNATFFVCVVFYVMGHFWGAMNCPPDCPPTTTITEPIEPQPNQPPGLKDGE